MLLADIPVDASQELHVALVLVITLIGTWIIIIVLYKEVTHCLSLFRSYAGNHAVFVGHTVFRGPPPVDFSRIRNIFRIYEEEELVLDDRSAKGESVSSFTVFTPFQIGAVDPTSMKVLILMIDISGSLQGIGTGLGDSIHTATDEVALTHIVRRNDHLHFLDCIDGDRVATAGERCAKTKIVVEVGPVNCKAGAAAGGSREVHSISSERRQLCNIGHAPADCREFCQLLGIDVGRCTSLLYRSELGSGGSGNYNFLQQLGIVFHGSVKTVEFTELKGYV